MSVKNGVWHNAKVDLPPSGEMVLCVKEKAKIRSLCFGSYWPGRPWNDGWITGGGSDQVIYWMPLPKIPGKAE